MQTNFSIPFDDLKQLAKQSGLEVFGVSICAAKPIESSRLRLWQSQGYAATMSYMLRDPELQANPLRLLPEAKSVLSFSVAYDTRLAPTFLSGYGKVARYAWGKDYHLVLPQRLERFVALVKEQFGDFKYRVFTDAVPLLERAFAASAGLGFIGKNTLLIRPKLGSFTLLAEILCEFEVSGFIADPIRSNCGSCQRCIDSCPTSAFKSEYVLDARRCISYLSIEKKGILSFEEREMLGEWIFGCDVCQEVCPFNHSSLKHELAPNLESFSAEFGAGPLLNLAEVLSISNQQVFKTKFKDSPLLRAKREGLLRNAICVAVNTAVVDLVDQLKILAKEDVSPLLRQFAYWGFAELSKKQAGKLSDMDKKFVVQGLADNSAQVVDEVSAILSE